MNGKSLWVTGRVSDFYDPIKTIHGRSETCVDRISYTSSCLATNDANRKLKEVKSSKIQNLTVDQQITVFQIQMRKRIFALVYLRGGYLRVFIFKEQFFF